MCASCDKFVTTDVRVGGRDGGLQPPRFVEPTIFWRKYFVLRAKASENETIYERKIVV